MNRYAITVLFVLSILTGCSGGASKADVNVSSTSALGVDDFIRAGAKVDQSVFVEGVVARVEAPQHRMALIDDAEFEECEVTTCATIYLPIRWTGDMPAPKELISVKGQVATEGGKLIVIAKEITKRPAPKKEAGR